MLDWLILGLGVAAAGIGGELFVRGSVGIAAWWRVPAGIIGLTIAAFATSSPELAVSVIATLNGDASVALGNALGSNVVNIGLVLGIAAYLAPIAVPADIVRRDFPLALLAPIVTAALALDGRLSRLDGVVLLAMFAAWLYTAVAIALRHRADATQAVLGERRHGRALAEAAGGLAILFLAGRWIVAGAGGIAASFGLHPFVVGATIVAAGTSVPELATVLIARWRKHDEVGLGTVLGSNLFNGLFIIGLTILIRPVDVRLAEIGSSVIFGALLVGLVRPGRGGALDRRRGALLLVLYAAYVLVVAQAGGAS
ncbi:MAG: calcium/sodium antiporter [Ardenticatenales bacterium]|nr:calcium/sodium antiporter [Ardenticatenales bacterium]